MDVLLDAEEELLREAARRFFEAECDPARVRAAEDAAIGCDRTLWAQLAELGWLGLALPASAGGSEAPLTHLGLLFEEAGRALAPVPLHPHTVAAGAIADGAAEAARARLLPAAAAGGVVLTWAWHGTRPGLGPEAVELLAEPDGNGWRLSGEARFVEAFDVCGGCLVAARLPGTAGTEGICLLLVEPDAAGLGSELATTLAGDRQARLTFDAVRVAGDGLLGTPGEAWPLAARMLERAVALNCALVVGATRRAAERAFDYAKERVAFDRPIGAFQAIQHLCADMITWVDGAELLTREALWRLDAGLDATTEVSAAKAFVNERCQAVLREANQIHGGVAQVREHDQQLWYRRAAAWTMRLGTAIEHRKVVARGIAARAGARPGA